MGKSQQGERSYHIFYQVRVGYRVRVRVRVGLANSNPSILLPARDLGGLSLSLENAASYRYLASCTHVPSIDDAADFEAMSTAFSAMGFSSEDVQARASAECLSGSVVRRVGQCARPHV